MSDNADYKLDISTLKSPIASGPDTRPYLSVLFDCCSVYQRIYRDLDGKKYQGRCPKCGRSVTFGVGPGGTTNRFFVVR